MGRAAEIVVGDALDKAWNVDAGRAGGLAGRIEAVIAAVGLDTCLGQRQWWVRIAEILPHLCGIQAAGTDVGR